VLEDTLAANLAISIKRLGANLDPFVNVGIERYEDALIHTGLDFLVVEEPAEENRARRGGVVVSARCEGDKRHSNEWALEAVQGFNHGWVQAG
jgi:hypothetical protein